MSKALLTSAATVLSCAWAMAAPGPLSPETALQSFQTEPGLVVELVAAEPEVIDPVAMAFDEAGRLFVAENRGYPTSTNAEGIVACLTDEDGDGRYEHRTLFASGLHFPNGLMPWQGGWFVTDAPDLLYLKDTDQDGRADVRRVVLTGFSTDRSTQLRVNDPTLSLDGWIYLATGLSDGKVTSPDHPEYPPISLTRHDLRFHPHTEQFEAVDGQSQFGIAFDDFGRRFICMNRVQVQHVVLESRDLQRNPQLGFSRTVQDLPEARVDDLIPGHAPAAARLYPISDNITTADSHAGTFSAACAVTIWRGGNLPPEYEGRVFSCDPTANLIHWDELIPAGATFRARRSTKPTEFLASSDNWFRPVYLAEGPDGGLYVCDMYRQTIEHPDYLPEEVRKRTDFNGGKNAGRIWRVGSFAHPQAKPPALSFVEGSFVEGPGSNTQDLAEALLNQSSWHRQTAFRLLWERRDLAASPHLLALLGRTNFAPYAKASALALLNLLGTLDEQQLGSALQDSQAEVREFALHLCASRETIALTKEIKHLVNDPSPRVRFQCALTMGAQGPEAKALIQILRADTTDPWLRTAVFASAGPVWGEFFDLLIDTPAEIRDTGWANVLEEAARITRRTEKTAAQAQALGERILRRPSESVWQIALLSGLADLGQGSFNPAESSFAPSLQTRLRQLQSLATEMATNSSHSLPSRLLALRFLATSAKSRTALAQLLQPTEPEELQIAAVHCLERQDPTGFGQWMVESAHWKSLSAPAREAALAGLLGRRETVGLILDALENGNLSATAISPSHRQQLLKHSDELIRARAAQLLKPIASDRQAVFDQHRNAIHLLGQAAQGRRIFSERCGSCHRLDREGYAVGPDLFGIRNQSKEAILLHIIIPNREIATGFEACTMELAEDRSLTGLIVAQSTTSLTLRQALGLETTVARSEINSLRVSDLSYMPEGLEFGLTDQDLANLLGYLKGE